MSDFNNENNNLSNDSNIGASNENGFILVESNNEQDNQSVTSQIDNDQTYQNNYSDNVQPQQAKDQEESRYYTYQSNEFDGSNAKVKPEKRGFFKRATATVGFAMTFGIIAGLCIHFTNNYFGKESSEKTQVSIGGNNTTVTGSQALSTTPVLSTPVEGTSDVSSVVKNVMPSIVAITEKSTQTVQNYWYGYSTEQEVEGSGSGIIIKEDDDNLYIATNNHVISGAKTVEVTFDDESTASATVKGAVESEDIAVIVVKKSDLSKDTLSKIKVASLGDSASVKVGEAAIAIGNALGCGQSVTTGVISATNREISVSSSDNTITISAIQTDAAINPGNSGGALLNASGQVIGINSAKLASSEVEGMGYAIPISSVLPILNDIISKEQLTEDEQGYLGIVGKNILQNQQNYGLPAGVYISSVAENGPAQKAGLLSGDVITGINDTKISSMTDLSNLVKSYKVGTKITIKYKRLDNGEYKENSVEVTLAALPDDLKSSSNDNNNSNSNNNNNNNNNNNSNNNDSNTNNNNSDKNNKNNKTPGNNNGSQGNDNQSNDSQSNDTQGGDVNDIFGGFEGLYPFGQ